MVSILSEREELVDCEQREERHAVNQPFPTFQSWRRLLSEILVKQNKERWVTYSQDQIV